MLIITCIAIYQLIAGIYMSFSLATTENELSIAKAIGCLVFGGIVVPITIIVVALTDLNKIIIWRRK